MAGFQELVARKTGTAGKDEENTTEAAVRKVREGLGEPSSPERKQAEGRLVHYSFGTAMGAVYGLAREYVPPVGWGAGSLFGTALFLGTDEVTLPLLRLSKQPKEMTATEHLLHWAAHVVYNVTTELSFQVLRRAL